MKNTITFREMAAIKRRAKDVWGNYSKVESLKSKVAELQEEIKGLEELIDDDQRGIVRDFGYGVMQLVRREVRDGQTAAVYVPNPALLEWDEDKRVYNIVEGHESPEPEESLEPASNQYIYETSI